MRKQNNSDRSYTQQDHQGKLYVLSLNGFWGKVAAVAMRLLLVPLMVAFFLFFVAGLVVVAVIGMAYAWWHVKNLRRVHTPDEEDAIELAASEYQSLEESGEKARGTEMEREVPRASARFRSV